MDESLVVTRPGIGAVVSGDAAPPKRYMYALPGRASPTESSKLDEARDAGRIQLQSMRTT